MKLEMSFQLDCFIISQVKPLLPAFYTYCVNRICIIKAKINKNKMQMKTGGSWIISCTGLCVCVCYCLNCIHSVICLAHL